MGDQLTETVLSLGSGGCRVLGVGCGQGTQSLRLARQGHRVVGLDSSADLLARLRASLEAEPAPVRRRGFSRTAWWGVRVLSDHLDGPPPDGEQLAALLAAERAVSGRDPYRRVAALTHLVYRRS